MIREQEKMPKSERERMKEIDFDRVSYASRILDYDELPGPP